MNKNKSTASDRLRTAFDGPRMQTLVDEIGLFFERFGLRRNVGRTWGLLYLSPEPLDQASLADLLDLSAGLISDALKELEHLGAVRSLSVKGERRTFYEAEDRLLRTVATILAKRDLCAVRDLREAVGRAKRSCSPPGFTRTFQRRLREIEMVTDLYEVLTSLVLRIAELPTHAVSGATRLLRSSRIASLLEPADRVGTAS